MSSFVLTTEEAELVQQPKTKEQDKNALFQRRTRVAQNDLNVNAVQILEQQKAPKQDHKAMDAVEEQRFMRRQRKQLMEQYNLPTQQDAKSLQNSIQFLRLKRGEIHLEDYQKSKKIQSQIDMSRVAAMIQAGDEIKGTVEEEKAKEAKRAKAQLQLMQNELRKMQEQTVKFDANRFERLQNLGKSLYATGETQISPIRTCCMKRRARQNHMSQNQADIEKVVWDFRSTFNDIDIKVGSNVCNNPIFNKTQIGSYIDNAFHRAQNIKKRENRVKKAMLLKKIESKLQDQKKGFEQRHGQIQGDQESSQLWKFAGEAGGSFYQQDTQNPVDQIEPTTNEEADIMQTGASYKERLEMRKKAQETHRRQTKLLKNKDKLEKSVVYSRDKLYSSLTQFKYIDMFSNNFDEPDVKFKSKNPQRSTSVQKNMTKDLELRKLQISNKLGSALQSFMSSANNSPSKQSEKSRWNVDDQSEDQSQKQTKKEEPWYRIPKSQFMQNVVDTYDTSKGDEIDKHLFISDVINYLDQDIDKVNKKYNGRIGVGNRTEKASQKAMEDKKAMAQEFITERVRDTLHSCLQKRKDALEKCRHERNQSVPNMHKNRKSSAGKLRISVQNVDIMNKHNYKQHTSQTTKNEEAKKRIYPHQVVISRNFDSQAYRERLSKVQSHYQELNLTPGIPRQEALEQKQNMPSAAMISSQPPKNMYVSSNIRKKIHGQSQSYHYSKSRYKAGLYQNDILNYESSSEEEQEKE